MAISAEELFRRFATGGFERLVDSQPAELADFLENRAATTGSSTPLFISQAIRAVNKLFVEHDGRGGIRVGFIRQLDELVRDRLPIIDRGNPHWAAKLARDLRDEILGKVNSYDPQNSYE